MLLEGPEIEPLLAQVREEYGAGARIVNAEKVRVGGVGGFFAREHFELSVEVPDGVATPAPATPADAAGAGPIAPRSLDDLLNLAEAKEEQQPAVTPSTITPSQSTPVPGLATSPAGTSGPAKAPVRTPGAPSSAGASGFTPFVPPTVTATRTAAVRPAADTPAPPAATPATAGIPLTRPVPSTPPVPRASLVSTAGPAFADVMADLNSANLTTAASLALRPQAAPAVATPPVAAPAPATPAVVTSSAVTTPAVVTSSAVTTPAVVASSAVATRPPAVARLVDLGVPEPLAARVTGGDPYQEILDALAALPAPPRAPKRAGDVLVIAGELAHALPIAREVAQGLHLDPAKLLLVAPTTGGTGLHASRRISGPAEAHRRARTMHRAEVPHVVVVDAPITSSDDGWVRSISDALGATAVWAAVDATRKLADTARHLQLMGRVDATAVYATAACSDPAAVLGLNVPVALLERRPATAMAWATLLCERLRAAAGQLTNRLEVSYVTH
ncbi:hypothetical protein [Micromonospora pattaloongensis]|uniref:hypothetical protein n=1 Tax=Micromonospora pattaloongensis TaxID=405436 RepID=UPI000B877D4D|nr:hypothetical protein [Micromonospora pattaloongensis]